MFVTSLVPWNTRGDGPTTKVNVGHSEGTKADQPAAIWHKIMAHVNPSVISHMTGNGKYGMDTKRGTPRHTCGTCEVTKQVKAPSTGNLVDNAEDMTIHVDSCGPFQTRTIGGKKYFLAMTNTPHRYTKVQLLTHRGEVEPHIQEHIAWLERVTGKSVKRVHADNAKEFLSLRTTLKKSGIRLTTSSAYTPTSNGVAERINRTPLDKVWAMIKEAGMKTAFWVRLCITLRSYIIERPSPYLECGHRMKCC